MKIQQASILTDTFSDTRKVPLSSGDWASALSQWRAALGDNNVLTDEKTLQRYARSTANAETLPLAVVLPKSTSEVQQIVRFSALYGIALYPLSRGRNWGYGDACAPTPGQVIVDLSHMNRIIEVDVELGYARLEAGVSQGELYQYLRDNNIPLWMDATAAGPEASIVGNTLDRGYGHTRYGDRSLHTCGMTVVLPDATLLHTGFGHFPNAKAAKVYRNGVGPSVDGLFFQSNFGIVTEMGVWLMPQPEDYNAFFFSAQSDEDLAEIIACLAPLKRQGLLPSAIHIANDLRILCNRSRYPWQQTNGQTPLPTDVRMKLRRDFKLGAWIVCGALYGTPEVVGAIRKRMRKDLKKFRPVFLNDRKMHQAERLAQILSWFGLGKTLKQNIINAKPIFDLLKGIPTNETVRGGEWRLRPDAPEASSQDPLASQAGLMWVSPVLPMTASAANEVLSIMDSVYHKHGFDTLVTFTMINDRAFCCVSNVAYDRRNDIEVQKAKACYHELYDRLIENGYIPYRSGPTGFAKLSQSPSGFWDLAARLKQAVDPQGIISPGRYIPSLKKS